MIFKIRKFFRDMKYDLIRLKYLLRGYDIGKKIVISKKGYINKEGFKAGYNIYIGPYHYISSNTKIGNFCLISDHVNIIGDDHIFEEIGTPTILAGRPINQPTTILEDDVWIGHAVTILRGVSIGEGSIVGANSIVTKDIPPYCIYGGNPAKFIRYRFNNEEERMEHSKKIQQLIEIKK